MSSGNNCGVRSSIIVHRSFVRSVDNQEIIYASSAIALEMQQVRMDRFDNRSQNGWHMFGTVNIGNRINCPKVEQNEFNGEIEEKNRFFSYYICYFLTISLKLKCVTNCRYTLLIITYVELVQA